MSQAFDRYVAGDRLVERVVVYDDPQPDSFDHVVLGHINTWSAVMGEWRVEYVEQGDACDRVTHQLVQFVCEDCLYGDYEDMRWHNLDVPMSQDELVMLPF